MDAQQVRVFGKVFHELLVRVHRFRLMTQPDLLLSEQLQNPHLLLRRRREPQHFFIGAHRRWCRQGARSFAREMRRRSWRSWAGGAGRT